MEPFEELPARSMSFGSSEKTLGGKPRLVGGSPAARPISRCQSAIIPKDHKAAAAKLRSLLAKYAEVELLLKIGEYKKGTDPEADEAIAKNGGINAFLRQGLDERPDYNETIENLKRVVS